MQSIRRKTLIHAMAIDPESGSSAGHSHSNAVSPIFVMFCYIIGAIRSFFLIVQERPKLGGQSAPTHACTRRATAGEDGTRNSLAQNQAASWQGSRSRSAQQAGADRWLARRGLCRCRRGRSGARPDSESALDWQFRGVFDGFERKVR